jgi:hypothetical protein
MLQHIGMIARVKCVAVAEHGFDDRLLRCAILARRTGANNSPFGMPVDSPARESRRY